MGSVFRTSIGIGHYWKAETISGYTDIFSQRLEADVVHAYTSSGRCLATDVLTSRAIANSALGSE